MPGLNPDLARRNRKVATGALLIGGGMLALSFASVPLYTLFCSVTGYGGTPQIGGAAAPGIAGKSVTVRFNANTHPGLPWSFQPGQNSMQVVSGQDAMAFYTAESRAAGPSTGISTYNVTPEVAGPYFHKVHCFCFDEQTLQAGQRVEMPLSFWIDPKIADDPNTRDIRTITLSYTFFRTLADAERAGALAKAGPHVGKQSAVQRP
ncbi:cytochrome c oxidase assembly protein [Teichococcus vastitatis]|jgi:cytochrome c oxidase assembly protein subunit 11|uniref:Cytochrome c oxidase assembly protein CtaG n=1 Tax=Teichococcus vastitatis TaxID=2307076 RepID=A0ABS9W556_9PROT|nr:cytochrome c oxidase assembly protein [Pseudoroseomonas vastitatis]MCI0754348.1 cytochrome c oxidase assembly protein [Pseudoroseomonas vastitatis]